MFRISSRYFASSVAAAGRFFNANSDAEDDELTSAARSNTSSVAGGAIHQQESKPLDEKAEERRRLKILSKDLGVQAANIFDRLTTALEEFEDIDRRVAMSTSALTQRLAFDEMAQTALASSLQDIISDAVGPSIAESARVVGNDDDDVFGYAKARQDRQEKRAAMERRGPTRADDDRLDALALKRSLFSLEYEFFHHHGRRQAKMREAERTGLARERAKRIHQEKAVRRERERTDSMRGFTSITSSAPQQQQQQQLSISAPPPKQSSPPPSPSDDDLLSL